MIRILHIIPTLDRGGAEKQLTLLAAGLPRQRFDVHVCCLTRGGPLESDLTAAQIPYTILGKRWKFDPFAYSRLKKQIQEFRPDIVHTWLYAANSYGRQAALACGTRHILANERCVDPWKTWWQFACDRYLARRTGTILTNSSGVVDFYSRHGIPAEKFHVIPNGVPASSLELSTAERSQLLQHLELPPTARIVLAVSRLWPQKRLKDLIWSLDLLQCVVEDAYLLIAGDGPLRWRLERYARQVSPAGHVRVLGERADVPRLMRLAECLWLGSEYEGQSNAIMEAMQAGLPVVATSIPGNRDLVVPGQTGYLVPVGDRAGFAARTRELLEQPELAKQLGRAGQARMAQAFTVEQMVNRYAEFYEKLLQ